MKNHKADCKCMGCRMEKKEFVGKNNPQFKEGLPHCIDCKKELAHYGNIRCWSCFSKFTKGINHNQYKHGKYCNKHYCVDCKREISSNGNRCRSCSRKLDSNPNWHEGSSFKSYSLEWTKELKEYIRFRDNYKCQNCNITEDEHFIIYDSVLNVHHIDYNKQNCNKNNLITLCVACNSKANYHRDYWEKYYKDLLKKVG